MNRPSRSVWITALVVSVVCVSGLAYALWADWNTPAERTLPVRTAAGSSGFALGVLVGLGAGIVLGSLIAARKK